MKGAFQEQTKLVGWRKPKSWSKFLTHSVNLLTPRGESEVLLGKKEQDLGGQDLDKTCSSTGHWVDESADIRHTEGSQNRASPNSLFSPLQEKKEKKAILTKANMLLDPLTPLYLYLCHCSNQNVLDI